jgi:hypothetical protein
LNTSSNFCGTSQEKLNKSYSPVKNGEEEKSNKDPLLEKLIEYNFSTKLTSMCFEFSEDLLCIGFSDGKIECFKIEIEPIIQKDGDSTKATVFT